MKGIIDIIAIPIAVYGFSIVCIRAFGINQTAKIEIMIEIMKDMNFFPLNNGIIGTSEPTITNTNKKKSDLMKTGSSATKLLIPVETEFAAFDSISVAIFAALTTLAKNANANSPRRTKLKIFISFCIGIIDIIGI